MAESLHNPYFYRPPGTKDVWLLINETAAEALLSSGKPVTNLGQGFFSYNPPSFVSNAVSTALQSFNQYAPARGNPNLLQNVAAYYSKAFNRPVSIDEVQITTGANEGMFAVFFGFLCPGDEVIVFEPFFDQYVPNIEMTGAKVKYVSLKFPPAMNERNVSGDEWEIDWDGLEKTVSSKTKMIVINTPHNPIGKVFTEDELARLGRLVIKHNLLLVSDEVYDNLYFGPSFPRPAALSQLPELAERTFTVGLAGKAFAATGWRIGYVHAPANLLKYVTSAHVRICFCSPSPLQQAVSDGLLLAANNSYFEDTRQHYKLKYLRFCKVFDQLGLPYTVSQGGYFLLVNFSKVKVPAKYDFPPQIAQKPRDFHLAYWLIREIGVVGIPPTEFVPVNMQRGHGLESCLRFAVCKDDAILDEAVQKLLKLEQYL